MSINEKALIKSLEVNMDSIKTIAHFLIDEVLTGSQAKLLCDKLNAIGKEADDSINEVEEG